MQADQKSELTLCDNVSSINPSSCSEQYKPELMQCDNASRTEQKSELMQCDNVSSIMQ